MLSIIVFIIILGLMIFVHELGHFVVAKRSGIVVEEFGFGYPPRLLKLWQSEGSITISGKPYIIGPKTQVSRELAIGSHVSFETGTDSQGRTIITHLAVVHDEDEAAPHQAAIVEDLRRPTEYTLNIIPFGGFVRMLGEEDPSAPGSFAQKSKRIRVAVLVAGALMNLIMAVVVFSLMYMTGIPEPKGQVIIQKVALGSPAEQAGIMPGDIISSVNGQQVDSTLQVATLVNANKGSELILLLKRNSQDVPVRLVPRLNPPPGEGAVGIQMDLKVTGHDMTRFPAFQALAQGAQLTALTVVNTFYIPIAIIKGLIAPADARPIGVYGMYQLADSAVGASVKIQGLYPLLFLTGILSAALGITQLLPLPALDGGRIFFIIIEALRGRRISPEKEGAIHLIGLALFLALMLVITYYDVAKPLQIPDWTSLY